MRVVAHRAGNDLDRARAAAAAGLVVEVDVPLAPLTTFRIGGPADYLVRVRTADELEREVELARERGWAANVDEWIAGLSVLAAPVLHRGRPLAHVALAAPTVRAHALGLDALAERVRKTAERIAQRLAGDGV